jgi:hypothetical protein
MVRLLESGLEKMTNEKADELRINLPPLTILVKSREFPEDNSYWSGNFLEVRAECREGAVRAVVEGPYIHVSELKLWLEDLENLRNHVVSEAVLECLEPLIKIKIAIASEDAINCEVSLIENLIAGVTPHEFDFSFQISLDAVDSAIGQLRCVLEKYPLKNALDSAK